MAEETREIRCPRCESELTELELGSLLGQFGTRKRMASGKNLGGRPKGKTVVLNSDVGQLASDHAELAVFSPSFVTEEVASLRAMIGRVEAGVAPRILANDEPGRSVSPFEQDTARKQGTGWREKLAELEAMEPGWAAEAMADTLRGVKLPGKWSSMKRDAKVEWLEENSPMGAK